MKFLVCLIGSLAFSAAVAGEDIDERQDADPNGDVEVSNVSGEVRVTGWDEDVIEITGELGNGVDELVFERDGKHTTIKVKGERMRSSDLYIKVPEGSNLEVNTVSADIEVDGVHGMQRLQSVSGDITSQVYEDDFEAKTVSGDLELVGNNARTLVTLTTVSGDAEIENISGEVEVTTVSGEIDIKAGVLSRARLRATNGELDIEGELEAGGRYDLSVVNGEVDVLLHSDANLDVDIETFNGDIDNCFGEKSERKSEYGPGRFLRFSRGDADRTVRIRAFNGDVDICSRNTSD